VLKYFFRRRVGDGFNLTTARNANGKKYARYCENHRHHLYAVVVQKFAGL
jgi:hypothetical protein